MKPSGFRADSAIENFRRLANKHDHSPGSAFPRPLKLRYVHEPTALRPLAAGDNRPHSLNSYKPRPPGLIAESDNPSTGRLKPLHTMDRVGKCAL